MTGICDVELVKERGLYNASELDKALASKTQRGNALLEDAGEDLIGNTFLIVNDIRYIDRSKGSSVWGGIVKGLGAAAAIYTGSSVVEYLPSSLSSASKIRLARLMFLYV